MSELDNLLVTFQTQLSDVMETVVKTAMFEVTRLVEDGFLEEVKRRNQEVESLRMQLQWVEKKLRKDGQQDIRNGQCVSDGVQLPSDIAEEPVDGLELGCGVKTEADSAEQTDTSHREEILASATQAAEDSETTHCINVQITDAEDVLPRVDVKEEEVNKPFCSSADLGEWRGITKGKPVPESSRPCNTTEAQSRQTPENNKELLSSAVKPVITQVSTACFSTEEQQDTHMADDLSIEEDGGWAGLTVPSNERLQNHIHATDKDCNPDKATGPLTEGEHNLSDSVTADINALIAPFRDQISSSASLQTRLINSDVLGVTIKQEVSDGFDECVDSELRKKRVASFSSLVRQNRSSPGALGHNPISHKAKVQEMIKPHSKMGTGLRLQSAVHQLSRPIRKSNHALSNSTTTALSAAHSQAGSFKSVNKIPPMSKAAPPPPPSLSVQRVHLGDKQATVQNRNVAPWVGIKTQHNAHHSNASPHLDSHTVGPRQLQRCGQCGKCFPHPSNLKAHLQTHTGERPFCCSLCGRSFTKLSNLKAHRRVHTGERPYCCLACGKRFTQKCNLKRHQRIHLDL